MHNAVERVEVGNHAAVVLSWLQDKLGETLNGVGRISGEVEGQRRRYLVKKGGDRGRESPWWEFGLLLALRWLLLLEVGQI